MPHLSPIAWVFLYVMLWVCFVLALSSVEFFSTDLR